MPAGLRLRPGWTTDLEARHARPVRVYHTYAHVREVVERWAEVERDLGWPDPQVPWLAALLHDVVYVVGQPDNEARSADLVGPWTADFVEDPVDTEAVRALILATAAHGRLTDPDPVTALFLDCDMAVLGAPPERYARYEADVRAEWLPVVGEQAWQTGRRRFLESVLSGPIFLSTYWRDRLGDQARENLRGALDAL